MGRDSHSKGCGFKSRHRILDGHFFTYICCKNCNVCLKIPKINKKEAGVGPFKKITMTSMNLSAFSVPLIIKANSHSIPRTIKKNSSEKNPEESKRLKILAPKRQKTIY